MILLSQNEQFCVFVIGNQKGEACVRITSTFDKNEDFVFATDFADSTLVCLEGIYYALAYLDSIEAACVHVLCPDLDVVFQLTGTQPPGQGASRLIQNIAKAQAGFKTITFEWVRQDAEEKIETLPLPYKFHCDVLQSEN